MDKIICIENIKKKFKSKNIYIITLSDGRNIEIMDEVIYKFRISAGEILSDVLDEAISETEYLFAKEKMLQYIRNKNRTFFEINEYLKKQGFNEDTIKKEIEFVKKFELADDVAYARKYIKESIRKGNGVIKIRRELKRKGIGKDVIEQYIQKYVTSENTIESAMNIARKKIRNEKINEKTYGKVGRYLAMKGFEREIIYKVLDKLITNNL